MSAKNVLSKIPCRIMVFHIHFFSFLSQETSGVDNYSEFKSKWNPDAFYPSTVLTFITEKLLPYWLQCKTCQKWRKIQNSHLKEENLIDKDLGKSITLPTTIRIPN